MIGAWPVPRRVTLLTIPGDATTAEDDVEAAAIDTRGTAVVAAADLL